MPIVFLMVGWLDRKRGKKKEHSELFLSCEYMLLLSYLNNKNFSVYFVFKHNILFC